jgi:hypothetical protein
VIEFLTRSGVGSLPVPMSTSGPGPIITVKIEALGSSYLLELEDPSRVGEPPRTCASRAAVIDAIEAWLVGSPTDAIIAVRVGSRLHGMAESGEAAIELVGFALRTLEP